MANPPPSPPTESDPGRPPDAAPSTGSSLESATYEVLRQRLSAQAITLTERLHSLDAHRREVFGAIESRILQADRISTAHHCRARDMVRLGPDRFLFGFNVQFGLKRKVELSDVFAIFDRDETAGTFRDADLEALADPRFLTDFQRLYHVYDRTAFAKFSVHQGTLFMVFQIGASTQDLAVFKWAVSPEGLQFIDSRAEAEYRRHGYPPSHPFTWKSPDRQSFRYGDHPHVSLEDRVFVECIGGDLTLKVEDNTRSGQGLYSEPVDDPHQKVDDAEIHYAILEPLILIRVRPYKETAYRHFIYHSKLQTVDRVDSLGTACARLPEDHGLIFPDGYYLATGELKRFDSREPGLILERILHSPNGEDSLYVFYSPTTGTYALLPYRLISQKVEERITCHGFSLFPNGHLLLLRADEEPQKHHQAQLRQTPFHEKGHEPPGRRDAYLYQLGNKDVVRALAETHEILSLARRDPPYDELFVDLVRRCETLLDAHPWLTHAEAGNLAEPVHEIREVARRAVDEFARVRQLRREAAQQVADAAKGVDELLSAIRRTRFQSLADFVGHLASLRRRRGELISLREVRYVEPAQVDPLEQQITARTDEVATACVQFLLQPAALDPYRSQAESFLAQVDKVTRAAEGRRLEEQVATAAAELEMLIEIVHGLRIEDATETTRILDGITAIYATLNQVRAALRKHLQSLGTAEAAAQFEAQLKLLGQSAAGYLDRADAPERCDESLHRLNAQIEELEGAFAEHEEFTLRLAERRAELAEAFEQRKLALLEQRNKRAQSLLAAGERLLKVIASRLAAAKALEDIHSFLAGDPMVAKIRDTVAQLLQLGDPVKADDLDSRLKTARQDAIRQLKDRQELFVDGAAVIRLGRHRFNVNAQALDLTLVPVQDHPHLHLTGTKFFEPVKDEAFLATRDAWGQEVLSENSQVYRAEFLAHRSLAALLADPSPDTLSTALTESPEARLSRVQAFMAPRYSEGYARGLHDVDAAHILGALLEAHAGLDLARFAPHARACALAWWHRFTPPDLRQTWAARLHAFAERNRVFPGDPLQAECIASLTRLMQGFARDTALFPEPIAPAAAEYLFLELTSPSTVPGSAVITRETEAALHAFRQHLVSKGAENAYATTRQNLANHPANDLGAVRDWTRGFLRDRPEAHRLLEEVSVFLFLKDAVARRVVTAPATRILEGFRGAHPRIDGARYSFDYLEFQARLAHFEQVDVPRFQQFVTRRQDLLQRERDRLRLESFQARVLSSFVRNQLIDDVYLPLIGDNLAKQIGAAGDQKRTDLMGLLLLISPPGYGKTTLVEYLASRLGMVYVKINGPALGHRVTSLDPQEAPNAAARDEIERLNLAFEMGDNVMLIVDDIQHCHAEFLQKFISLCDAQRKIEGVWRGTSRTYDLRGRKFAVVMAGNPYTESGQKFRLPDMLANRADTYNLGDIVGGRSDVFEASYLENAITSNPTLAPLAQRSQHDVRRFIKLAAQPDAEQPAFEGRYSAREMEEILTVLRHLLALRDIVLKVNAAYIHSAGQSDEFRTEPPFRLQGSYRNMNRLAEKVIAIMNPDEIQSLVLDHYRNESQTLTTGAEANFLKFKELIGILSPDEAARWEEICRTFRRQQLSRGGDSSDPVGRVVAQLAAFHAGLESIQQTLATQLQPALASTPTPASPPTPEPDSIPDEPLPQPELPPPPSPVVIDLAPLAAELAALRAVLASPPAAPAPQPAPAPADLDPERLERALIGGLDTLRNGLEDALRQVYSASLTDRVASLTHELEMIHATLATLKDLALRQRDHLRASEELLAARARQGTLEFEVTQEMLGNERAFLERFHEVLASSRQQQPTSDPTSASPPPSPSDPPPPLPPPLPR
jgi:hypothetical protein